TLGVRRGSTYHLKNSISGGVADQVVTYGRAGDDVLVGDWDGDGRDTLGVHRGNVFYAKNTIAGGAADVELPFGRDTETALAGDWDGDGVDTPGVRSSHAEPVDPSVAAAAAYAARMIELINEERRAAGVPPVAARPALRPAALRHSTWMAKEGVIQHARARPSRPTRGRSGAPWAASTSCAPGSATPGPTRRTRWTGTWAPRSTAAASSTRTTPTWRSGPGRMGTGRTTRSGSPAAAPHRD